MSENLNLSLVIESVIVTRFSTVITGYFAIIAESIVIMMALISGFLSGSCKSILVNGDPHRIP